MEAVVKADDLRRSSFRRRPESRRFEVHEVMHAAIAREKAIKNWKRRWKIAMIEAHNPDWRDLYPDLL
jgi:predicted GIY-YIG superfamily endonuclease